MSDPIGNDPKDQSPSLTLVEPLDPTKEIIVGETVGSGLEARQEILANGWTLMRYGEEDEPRVLDIDIAKKLEFARPRDIRKIIKRLIAQDRMPGEVLQRATVSRYESKPGIWQKREDTEYHLTEKQALKVATQSKTDKANEVTDTLISVFVAVRQKLSSTTIQPTQPNLPAELTPNQVNQLLKALVPAIAGILQQAQSRPTAPQLPTAAEIDAQTRQLVTQRQHEAFDRLLKNINLAPEQKQELDIVYLETTAGINLSALKPTTAVGWKTTQQVAMELKLTPNHINIATSLANLRSAPYYRQYIYSSDGTKTYCPNHSPEAVLKIKEYYQIP